MNVKVLGVSTGLLMAFSLSWSQSGIPEDFQSKVEIQKDWHLLLINDNNVQILHKEKVVVDSLCAVAGVDPDRQLISARQCPMEKDFEKMEYWDEHPLSDAWGVRHFNGEWIIDPIFRTPINLNADYQIVSYPGGSKLFIGVEPAFNFEYTQVQELAPGLFLVERGDHKEIRNLKGELIAQADLMNIKEVGPELRLYPELDDRSPDFNGAVVRIAEGGELDTLAIGNRPWLQFIENTLKLGDTETDWYRFDSGLTRMLLEEHFDRLSMRYDVTEPIGPSNFKTVFCHPKYGPEPRKEWTPFVRFNEPDCYVELLKSKDDLLVGTIVDFKVVNMGSRGPAFANANTYFSQYVNGEEGYKEMRIANILDSNCFPVIVQYAAEIVEEDGDVELSEGLIRQGFTMINENWLWNGEELKMYLRKSDVDPYDKWENRYFEIKLDNRLSKKCLLESD